MIKQSVAKVKNNPIGAIVGAGVTFFAMKKYSPVKKIWVIGLVSVIGGVAGAYAQSAIKAKASVPTKKNV